MYPISNAVKALFDAEQKQVLRITGTDRNGTSISITDADVMIGGFNIDRYSCNGSKLEIGTAIAAQMELKLNNANGAFDSIVFEGAELYAEIGIADWTQSNPTISYIPIGYFTPDQQPRRLATISLKALDRMTRFDAVPPTLLPWKTQGGDYITDSQGNVIYFLAEIAFPKTVAQLVADVCDRCNVPFSQSLTAFPNYDYTITSLPALQQKITYRNLIQWCAGIMGTCAYIDWTGELKFGWYAVANFATTTSNRHASDLYENDITVTGVQYTNTQGVTIVSGSADYAVDMSGNYLAEKAIATILPNVKNALNGFTYRPFAASVIAAPYLWPLDIITFTDKDGNDHNCCVTNVNFGLNGVTNIEGKGETAQLNDGVAPVGVTSEQARLIEQAYEVATELDKSLDQEGVFNRLTNYGAAQGIYIIDGQVYVNMTYARSGTLVLGGLNNQNGLLKVLDASGDEIGTWNNDGIALNKGTIVFPLTGGGSGNYIALNQNGIPFESYQSNQNGACRTSIHNFAIRIKDEVYDSETTIDPNAVLIHDKEHNNDLFPQLHLSNDVTGNDTLLTPYGLYFRPNTSNASYFLYDYLRVNGNMYVSGSGSFGNGASGSFTTADGKTVTVANGIITAITNNAPAALTLQG